MLRVGVNLESPLLPAWVVSVLEQIDKSDSVELCLVITGTGKKTQSRRLHAPLFALWEGLDRWFFHNRPRRKDASEQSPFVPKPNTPMLTRPCEFFTKMELDAAGRAGLDVILDFTDTQTVSSGMKSLARLGWWSIGSIPALAIFANMQKLNPVQEAAFDVHRRDETMRVRCSLFAGFPMSLYQNRNHVCWRTAEAVIRSLEGLDRFGWGFLNRLRAEALPVAETLPSNVRVLSFLFRLSMRGAWKVIQRTFLREDWFIAYGPSTTFSKKCPTTVDFKVVRAPRENFYADPFVVEKDERTFVFFEDYIRESKRAGISCMELRKDGSCSVPERVLEKDYHLSYPCVFEWCGEMYMIPESISNRTIDLYRASDFPRGWHRVRTLVENVSCVDSTILEYEGKFWLFTCGTPKPNPIYQKTDDELLLYFADTPLGPWTPHPLNPVVCDARSCRPAGRLFYENGVLIRPSQDCSENYGRAVTLNRVQILTQTEYEECPVATIGPAWFPGNIGTHTYDRSASYQVVDGRTWAGSRLSLRRRGRFVQHVVNKTELILSRRLQQQSAA
jgi:hypothetical protein